MDKRTSLRIWKRFFDGVLFETTKDEKSYGIKMKRPGIINMKKLRNIPEKSCHDLKKIHKILEKVKDFMLE